MYISGWDLSDGISHHQVTVVAEEVGVEEPQQQWRDHTL